MRRMERLGYGYGFHFVSGSLASPWYHPSAQWKSSIECWILRDPVDDALGLAARAVVRL